MPGFHLPKRWALVATTVACGCHYVPQPKALDGDLQSAAATLDQLKWYADAYGTTAMSSPLFVQPDDSFKFSLSQVTPDTFFASEKNEISGRAAGTNTVASVSGVDSSASVDLVAMQQYAVNMALFRQAQSEVALKQQIQNQAAIQQYQASLQAAQGITDPVQRAAAINSAANLLNQGLAGPSSTATPALPTPATPPALPSAPDMSNAAAAMIGPFAAPQTLFAQGTPPVAGSTRAALLMAAGDSVTNAMLALLGDASKTSKYSSKRVFFGLTMVSAMPGWKTRQGYAADIQAHLAYKWTFARPAIRDAFLAQKGATPIEAAALQQLQSCVATSMSAPRTASLHTRRYPPPEFDGVQFRPYVYPGEVGDPIVSAISPMGDAQSLDLQGSFRAARERALQMAFSLSYAGLSAQAKAFMNFANQHQQDVETRTSNVVVSAYSRTEATFGFEVFPRAGADPKAGELNDVLNVPTFPVLLIIGADDEDLRPRVLLTRGKPSGVQCEVVEPQIEFYHATRWIPLSEPCFRVNPMYWGSHQCVGETLTEEERYRVTNEVTDRLGNFGRGDDIQSSMYKQAVLLLEHLNGEYEQIFLPPELLQPIPAAAPKPTADTIAPAYVELERDPSGQSAPKFVQLIVAGDDLDQIDLAKMTTLSGKIQWMKDENTPSLTPTMKLVGKSLQATFKVSTLEPVVFKLPVKNSTVTIHTAPLAIRPPRDLFIERSTTDAAAKTNTDKLDFSAAIPDHVVRAEIEREKKVYPQPSANVSVDVQATDQKSPVKKGPP